MIPWDFLMPSIIHLIRNHFSAVETSPEIRKITLKLWQNNNIMFYGILVLAME